MPYRKINLLGGQWKEKETLNYTYQKGSLDKETRKSTTSYNVWIKENMPIYTSRLYNHKKVVEYMIDRENNHWF